MTELSAGVGAERRAEAQVPGQCKSEEWDQKRKNTRDLLQVHNVALRAGFFVATYSNMALPSQLDLEDQLTENRENGQDEENSLGHLAEY
jgi:hypothetical protein